MKHWRIGDLGLNTAQWKHSWQRLTLSAFPAPLSTRSGPAAGRFVETRYRKVIRYSTLSAIAGSGGFRILCGFGFLGELR